MSEIPDAAVEAAEAEWDSPGADRMRRALVAAFPYLVEQREMEIVELEERLLNIAHGYDAALEQIGTQNSLLSNRLNPEPPAEQNP